MWGKTQVSFGTFGIYEQRNITVFAMTVAGSSAIPWRPPEAALYLGVIELCTSRLLFQSHDTLPPIILVAEPLLFFRMISLQSVQISINLTKASVFTPNEGTQKSMPVRLK